MHIHPGNVYVAASRFGRGVFASRGIEPGERLLEFYGPRLSFDEAVALGERESYALQIERDEYILPAAPACLVNHSCAPNTGIRGLILVALRPISVAEELSYDYSTTMDEDCWQMTCACREAVCRRTIRDFKYLSDSTRTQYLHAGIVQQFIARDYSRGESGAAEVCDS
jgi:hypothetical protein